MTTIKRFLTLFTILTTLSLNYAWGQTPITLSSGSASGGVITWSASGVCTITQAASGTSGETAPNSSYISAPRWYKWNIITFTAASGKKFDEITIVCTSAAYATALAGSTYTTTAGTGSVSASASSTTVTISITGTVTAFTINMGGQSRPSSITVTSSTSGSTPVATPTFSPAEGTYSSTQSVTISCAITGATIYYTTDGSTPTTSSTEYSSAISVSTTTTIKAIATKSGMDNSGVASATYTITGGGGGGGCSYDLSTNSYESDASTTQVSWISDATATMVLTKNTSGTNANNYLGGDANSRTSSRFYGNQVLTITPKTGKTISSIIFTATTTGYASALANSTWSNATASASGSEVTVTPTNGTNAITATIGGTCGFTCVEFVGGTTYTVTATSNYLSYGTVSVSGYTITATPATGYVADGSTVTSGTATVSQSGNIYTVTPSSDCTVQINFRAAASYTVTLNDNGKTFTETVDEGSTYVLPDEGDSNCEDATLLGWATGTYTGHATGTSTAPTYDPVGTEKTITGNTIFTAVYGTVTEDASDDYAKITSLSQLTTGDYIIAAHGAYAEYAMKNAVSGSNMQEESFTSDTDPISTTDNTLIWHITKTGDNYTIYNAAVNKYLALTSSATTLQTSAHNFTVTYSSGGWIFESTTTAGYQLAYMVNSLYFESATSQNKAIYLYKRGAAIGNYTSKPQCCTPPATALTISSDATMLVGSGVAHLSLNTGTGGGNGKNITWTTTGGTLSSQTNTGATLTLSTPGVYTVTATQPDDETDPDNVICGAIVTINITVKAQWTITFITKDNGAESTYTTITVTDGDTYTMPDLNDEYNCGDTDISFAGWVSDLAHTSVDAAKNSIQTATANTTWYAAWSASVETKTVTIYEKVTNVSSLSSGNIVIITNTGQTEAMGGQNTNNRAAVDIAVNPSNANQVYSTDDNLQELTLGKSGDYWTFSPSSGNYLYAASSSANYLKTQSTLDNNGKWTIAISDGAATITAQGTNTHKILKYNSSSHLFSCYESGQKAPAIYKKVGTTEIVVASSGVVTNNTTCTKGAVILAQNGKWITSAKGQKVKTVISVTAKSFDAAQILSVSNNGNTKFAVSLAATAVPAGTTGLTTDLTIEYTPTEADVKESATITLTAGDVTKNITVNGRSLPDEFVIIAKKSVWYALPANMDKADQHDGVEVTPDDPTTPTRVNAVTSTVIYSLKGVSDARYATAGNCVLLVGNGNKCLWTNKTAGGYTIRNWAQVANANTDQYEWLLTTNDGDLFTVTNPAHPDYPNRKLGLGVKYGLYNGSYSVYIVPVGCSSMPDNVVVSPKRVDATFSWISNASSMQINVTPKAGGATITKSFSSSPAYFNGLTELTEYTYTLIPDGATACQYEGEFKTTGPAIDAINWEENAIIIQVDKDAGLNPWVIIAGEQETGVLDQTVATELFFAKYFEGAGSMKLISIYNGTRNEISLEEYSMTELHAGQGKTTYGSTKNYPFASLGSIKAGQEIIFFSRPKDECAEQHLYACSQTFLEAMALKSGADQNPRWIECDGTTFPTLEFNGNDALLLKRGTTVIDIFGAQANPTEATTQNCRATANDVGWSGSVKNMDYGKTAADFSYITLEGSETLADYGINLVDENISITTARCILFRAKVPNGDATTNTTTGNTGTSFNTFTPSEWNGRNVCTSQARCEALGWTYTCTEGGKTSTYKDNSAATCTAYEDLGKFDYNSYFKDYSTISDDTQLNGYSIGDNEYRITIDNMKQYACLNVRLQLTDPSDKTNILTERVEQVPIVVTGAKSTNSDIFSQVIPSDVTPYPNELYAASKDRCEDCNVVVLSGGTLTKAADGATHDVPEVYNLKIYAGGKLVVPNTTNYTVNSLALRREEDAISMADLKGTLTVAQEKGVSLNVRINPSNWHYVCLPYDCNVEDITYVDGTPAVPETDFLLRWYDGGYRAANQSGGWTPITSGKIRKGQGFVMGIPGSGTIKSEFRFPMENGVIADEKASKTVTPVYGYGCDKDDAVLPPNNKGWNLIGNPYMMYYASDLDEPLMVGHLELNGTTHKYELIGSLKYLVTPDGWNGRNGYSQVPIDTHMKPFTAYFVQIGGSNPNTEQDIDFHVAKAGQNSIVRRRMPAEEVEDTHPVWFGVKLVAPNEEKDNTTLLISNDFTDDYDMMDDLVKMRSPYYQYSSVTTAPVLASRNIKGEMAFNALPDESAANGVPLNYYASSNGTYTFVVDEHYPLDEIKSAMLYDATTNQYYDLLADTYSFSTNSGDNTNRFKLYVRVERKKAPQIATDIDNLYDGAAPRKVLINGHVYIVRGRAVYDLTGKQLLNQ